MGELGGDPALYGGILVGRFIMFGTVHTTTASGLVDLFGTIAGGTFSGRVTCDTTTGYINGGTFNGDVIVLPTHITDMASTQFNGRLSFDAGVTWLHPGASLPAANKVLEGVEIGRGGVVGAIPVSAVLREANGGPVGAGGTARKHQNPLIRFR